MLAHYGRKSSLPLIAILLWAKSADAAERTIAGIQLTTRTGQLDVVDDLKSGGQRVVVGNTNAPAFWTLQQRPEGWTICYEDVRQTRNDKGTSEVITQFLAYQTEEVAAKEGHSSLVDLRPHLDATCYWNINIDERRENTGMSFTIQAGRGQFEGWYLSPNDANDAEPNSFTLRRVPDRLNEIQSGLSHRTIKTREGYLSIDGDGRRIVFQQNTSGFNGIWFIREGKQGWLISTETVHAELGRQSQYLSYRTTKDDTSADGKASVEMILLSDTPHANCYWQLEVKPPKKSDFDVHMRPRHGDFQGWYLNAGKDLSLPNTPLWKKRTAAILSDKKPSQFLGIKADGR